MLYTTKPLATPLQEPTSLPCFNVQQFSVYGRPNVNLFTLIRRPWRWGPLSISCFGLSKRLHPPFVCSNNVRAQLNQLARTSCLHNTPVMFSSLFPVTAPNTHYFTAVFVDLRFITGLVDKFTHLFFTFQEFLLFQINFLVYVKLYVEIPK